MRPPREHPPPARSLGAHEETPPAPASEGPPNIKKTQPSLPPLAPQTTSESPGVENTRPATGGPSAPAEAAVAPVPPSLVPEYDLPVPKIPTSRRGAITIRDIDEITEELLAQYFHLPSEVACKKLGIGLTVLKRQCRKYGIARWPYRKIKSLDRVIQNVKAGLVEGKGDKAIEALISEKVEVKKRMRYVPHVPRRQERRRSPHGNSSPAAEAR